LTSAELLRGRQPGESYVRIKRGREFRRVKAGFLIPREGIGARNGRVAAFVGQTKRWLVGRPLRSAEEPNERVGIPSGLSVFASDNISSSAYATEETMRVLLFAGAGALMLTLPITIAIIGVMAIVVASYLQTIRAYPGGGGSYIVSSENLGERVGLVAAAALLIDYILTVSVSVAAGVAALTSIFPSLFDLRVFIGVGLVGILCMGNLRGVRESGMLFTLPLYAYLLAIFGLIAYGLWLYWAGALPEYMPPENTHASEAVEVLGVLLILRAFASGCVALTGTEAVANGVPAFKPREWRNAQIVLVAMATLFGSIFLGISLLAGALGILPDPTEQETVVSQLTRTLVGDGSAYHYFVQLSTAILLVMAANTAFADFPRLASILSRDHFLPRVFAFRGDRLAFSGGIMVLATISSLLIVAFEGSVMSLIPLYTVGVFVAFTLSQAGMAKHWLDARRHGDGDGWWWRIGLNGVGALATAIVAVVVGTVKFTHGAWSVLLLIPALVMLMSAIRRHYAGIDAVERPETPVDVERVRPRVIVPVAALNIPARQALAFAQAIAGDHAVSAVHVTDDLNAAERLRDEWKRSPHADVELEIIESPYRSLAGPLLAYVDAVSEVHPENTLVIILPELVPGRWWEHLLHNQTALRLKAALHFHPGVIVASVPYHLSTTHVVKPVGRGSGLGAEPT
jgi:amino acid transporter